MGDRVSKGPDTILLVAALALALLGTAMVFSSSHRVAEVTYGDPLFFLKKQLLFVLVGILVMVFASRLPLTKMRPYIYPALIFLGVLLVFVFIPELGGKRVNGAARWVRIGPLSLQVSELIKLAVVFFLADYLARKQEMLITFWRSMFIPLGILAPFLVLIVIEPDYGSAVLICATALLMLFLGGARKRYLGAIGLLMIALSGLLFVAKPYRLARLEAFRNPWENREASGFQIVQSLMSYGSGGAFGVGIGDGMQKLHYLPEAHTDFILSIIAEEAGLFGVSLVLALFFVLVLRGALIALKAPDRFNSLLAAGITLLLSAQAIINIASSMALIPPKGLALPLVSYGGTALIINMAAVGVLLNISTTIKNKPIARLLKTTDEREGEPNWERRVRV